MATDPYEGVGWVVGPVTLFVSVAPMVAGVSGSVMKFLV
jgi:hypothetical protein